MFNLSVVMTGWKAKGMAQLLNASYTDRVAGGLTIAQWIELVSRIPRDWWNNPYAKDHPGCLPLQVIDVSTFNTLHPGS